MPELFCPWNASDLLIFSENVPRLFYYSHGVAIVSALLFGFFVFLKNPKLLTARILFLACALFSGWVFLDLAIWATNSPAFVMFWWSAIILVEVLVFACSAYFFEAFIKGTDVSLREKLLMTLVLLPVIALLPTKYNLSGVELESCLAMESPVIVYYTYAFEVFIALFIVHFAFTEYRVAREMKKKREIALIATGIILFLLAFSYGNIIGSITADWELAQYGLFGMPVFIGFLAFLIVRFKAFNIKLVGAQALIISLVVLIGSQFFFIQTDTNRVLTAITLIITGVIGINLVRSVKKEVAQRERIEKLAKELEAANARLKELDQLKSEFVSLATHQIRGPISAIKGYASMLLEGDYGAIERSVREPIQTIAESSAALAGIVQDFLDVSRIEQGKMKYEFTVFDFGKLARSVAEELAPTIERKGLHIKLEIPDDITVHADAGKLRQVIENLVDNALKYTPQGVITIKVRAHDGMARLSVADTGIGIAKETLPKLFRKFSRAEDASKANLHGTGLGLYVARQLVEAQGGSIRAKSEGEGRGSTFFVELPLRREDLT